MIEIQTDSEPVQVPGVLRAGWPEFCLRAPSEAHLIGLGAWATVWVLDADGKAVTQGDRPVAKRGIAVSWLGQIQIAPAVYATDGETVVTPATFTSEHHLNVRFSPDLDWQSFALALHALAPGDLITPHRAETGWEIWDTVLIDPASISSPAQVFL